MSYELASHPINPSQVDQTNYSPFRQLNYQQATLLVVEDSEEQWAILQFPLRKTFPDVTIYRTASRRATVSHIQEGLAGRISLPKLILQDLYLPRKEDGLRLLEDMRALLTDQQHVPILVQSSSVDPGDIREVYCHRASYYLVKPTTINGWLNQCQAIRQFWWEQGVLPIYAPLQMDGLTIDEAKKQVSTTPN